MLTIIIVCVLKHNQTAIEVSSDMDIRSYLRKKLYQQKNNAEISATISNLNSKGYINFVPIYEEDNLPKVVSKKNSPEGKVGLYQLICSIYLYLYLCLYFCSYFSYLFNLFFLY